MAMAYLLSNRRVTFLSLRVFVALIQHRDATSAAQALGIQPQRLYYQIRRLEAALGTPLFRTCSPDWLPTPTGVSALPKVLAMLAIWDQIQAGTRAGQSAAAAQGPGPGGACTGTAFWVRQATM
jgi:DNA-binding transcriptional LysR family regulator